MENSSNPIHHTLNTGSMILMSLFIGIIAGFGAIVFRDMIGFVHNLSFNGTLSFFFDANNHSLPSIFGWGIILVPVIGSVIVTWLTQTFAKEARGHGVPEVMDAIYYREGKIRPAVTIVKSIASSISIGTGGSVGREGPIIQIGAAFGSMLGQIMKMTHRQRIVLIAAGAAAGIAATFNAPIGGLAFAIELMLVTVNATNVALVAIATVVATIISHAFLGLSPSFFVPALSLPLQTPLNPMILLLCIPFAIITGSAAALFINSIYWFEDGFNYLIKNVYLRHMIGMFFLGVLIFAFLKLSGHYYVEGVGYATILDILKGALTNPWFLLLLFFSKLLATGLTLGSGASGGVFSPSLFLGACLGGAYALIVQHFFPGLNIPISMFAVAGMAAMVSGSTGAVITAIVMTFEQTRDYADIWPIMISVALTYAVRVRITSESIYTRKLLRRGRMLPQGLQAAISVNKRALHLMNKDFAIVQENELRTWLETSTTAEKSHCVIISNKDEIIGVLHQQDYHLQDRQNADNLIDKKFMIVPADTTWPTLLRTMHDAKAKVVLVSNYFKSNNIKNIIGIISQQEIVASAHETAKLLD